jgi:glucose/arabinose dehydrogenase
MNGHWFARAARVCALAAAVFLIVLFPSSTFAQDANQLKLVPRRIVLSTGKTFSLNIPESYEIGVAVEGLKRVRFLAKAPDGRLFVTDMHSLADNSQGQIYILGGFDAKTAKFANPTSYLENLHNPNSVAFYKDPSGQEWLYVALTEKLERFKFHAGDTKPSADPEVLATYPAYGLSYKYGGWHLTRTIVFGEGANKNKLYVSVGSSCNACAEKEEIRATVSLMDADGKNSRIIARGLRNAVGLKIADGKLYATNMGADHLGNDAPDDTMFMLDDESAPVTEAKNYGWPYCYFDKTKPLDDATFASSESKGDCGKIPAVFASFAAHGSPLGLEYFDKTTVDPELTEHFLVALHGSGHKKLKRGYKVVRVGKDGKQADFITGFMKNGIIYGRPCDILRIGSDFFLVTDDHAGVIYFLHHK